MSQTLRIPDELYQALQRYAEQRQQTPEEALAALLHGIESAPEMTPSAGTGSNGGNPERENPSGDGDQGEYLDPWEGFYGAFEAKYPDLTERHDYYIGQAALEAHEDDDDDDSSS